MWTSTLCYLLQVLDLNVDPLTGLVSTALGEELDGKAIKERLKKLSALQRVRMETRWWHKGNRYLIEGTRVKALHP
jgi:hypothetical protein